MFRKPIEHRAQIVKWARWGVDNEPGIHYRESRPMPLTSHLPLTTDCSGFATLCYRLAGCPDPNGLGYSGQGYTGTLVSHGKQIPAAKVRPGDLVIYGPGTGEHVAVIVDVTDPKNPLTVSHGEEKGPELVRVLADGRPYRFFQFVTTSAT